MSSGQLFIMQATPPGLLFAQEDIITSTSTATAGPFTNFPVWDFDATAREFMDFVGNLSGYSAGGLTLNYSFTTTTTATNNLVVWGAAIRRLNNDAEDLDSTAHAFDFNFATEYPANVIGELRYATLTFTDGADMDSAAAGEWFVLRLCRDATATGDNWTADAELHQALVLKET